ncbi:MAG: 6-phosphogluconolactonase [Propionibacteriaceae bacterium]|nr:6-phosphogluconolactonase [Propionibacteriaceae bacterium]
MTVRVHRYSDANQLCRGVASHLARAVAERQANGAVMTLCLSDGLAGVCSSFGAGLDTTAIDPARLDLWWSDERFVDITDPTRVSTKTLAALGTSWRFDPANVHPMPTASGNPDVDAAALQHAGELGDTMFDLAILAMGKDGSVAGLRPGSPAFVSATPHTVVGVTDDRGERLTLTMSTLARSRAVWFVASSGAAAETLKRVVDGDATLPAGALRGRSQTHMFVDEAAAANLPTYHCDL